MVFPIQRVDAILGENDVIIALVGVDDGRAHAGMRVHAGHDQLVTVQLREQFVEGGAEERAVALLQYEMIRGVDIEFRQELRPGVPEMTTWIWPLRTSREASLRSAAYSCRTQTTGMAASRAMAVRALVCPVRAGLSRGSRW